MPAEGVKRPRCHRASRRRGRRDDDDDHGAVELQLAIAVRQEPPVRRRTSFGHSGGVNEWLSCGLEPLWSYAPVVRGSNCSAPKMSESPWARARRYGGAGAGGGFSGGLGVVFQVLSSPFSSSPGLPPSVTKMVIAPHVNVRASCRNASRRVHSPGTPALRTTTCAIPTQLLHRLLS